MSVPPEIKELLQLPYTLESSSFTEVKSSALDVLKLHKDKLRVSIKKWGDLYKVTVDRSEYQGYFRLKNCDNELLVEGFADELLDLLKRLEEENISDKPCLEVI